MRAAYEEAAIIVEEGVGQQLKRRALMRACIFVNADDPGVTQNEYCTARGARSQHEAVRGAFGDRIRATE